MGILKYKDGNGKMIYQKQVARIRNAVRAIKRKDATVQSAVEQANEIDDAVDHLVDGEM